jgi:hypothetical protein
LASLALMNIKTPSLVELMFCQIVSKQFQSSSSMFLQIVRIVYSLEDAPTHLILGKKKRSLRLVFAIARGAWVLDPKWFLTALEDHAWPDEEDFETKYFVGAGRSRRDHARSNYQGLLNKFSFYVHPDLKEINPMVVQELIVLSGGKNCLDIKQCDVCIADEDTIDQVKRTEAEENVHIPHTVRPEVCTICFTSYAYLTMV